MNARIMMYLKLPLAALLAPEFPDELPEDFPPKALLNLFLKSLITSSSSGGV